MDKSLARFMATNAVAERAALMAAMGVIDNKELSTLAITKRHHEALFCEMSALAPDKLTELACHNLPDPPVEFA